MTAIAPGNAVIGKAIAHLRASPGKSATLLSLVIVLAGLILHAMTDSAPATAQAAQAVALSTNNDGFSVGTSHKTEDADSLQRWARKPIGTMDRNLFLIPLDSFPRDGAKSGVDSENGNGFWDRIAKSMSSRADQQEQRQILIDNVKIAASALKLQSTMFGEQSTAIISGEQVREGSMIANFRVEKIEMRRVVIEREGIRLALQMK